MKTAMLTDKATHKQLAKALEEVDRYADNSKRNQQVQRAFRRGKEKVVRRVNTPHHKYTAVYYYFKAGNEIRSNYYLVLKGTEGDSFACPPIWKDENFDIMVLHSHAINRYLQRSDFKGTFEEAQIMLMTAVGIFRAVHDSDTYYLAFVGGTFLGNVHKKVLHVRTFINNDQCHRNQQLWRIKSANSLYDVKKYMEEKTKELENA